MNKSTIRLIASIVLFVIAASFIGTGIYGMNMRPSAEGEALLITMRNQALLQATGEGAVESFVAAAKKEATARVRAEGGDMVAIREAVKKAEEETRANSSNSVVDYATVDTTVLNEACNIYISAMKEYDAEKLVAEAAYIEAHANQADEAEEEALTEEGPATAEESMDDGMDDMLVTTQPKVDMSGFVATPKMLELEAVADEKFAIVADALIAIYPVLDQNSIGQIKGVITSLLYQSGDDYTTSFDRFSKSGGAVALKGNQTQAQIIRYADDLITVGIALALVGLLVFFYQSLTTKLGIPRLIITVFFILLCVLSVVYDLSIVDLLSNTLVRTGMNLVLVLAMVPAIQCGISLNLGLPLGIIGGLIGGLCCIESGFKGWGGFAFAIGIGLVISGVLGYLYALLLNRLKGDEMAVSTYVGFSIVSLMCIGWLVLPFRSLLLRWPLGTGLRVTISVRESYRYLLNNFLAFDIGGVRIPTGLILFAGLCCFMMWMFMRSKTGIAMQAAGNNPRFAEAAGINVDKMRIVGTVISTMLGAVGIIVYTQSYGFMQLYTAPRMMGFVAASAILIGGASTTRARISHVIIGTFLFQGVLTLGMPVANVIVPQSTLSETMRILISNGIILYALTKSGGASRA